MDLKISELSSLSVKEKSVLFGSNIKFVSDILLQTAEEISRRTQLGKDDVERIFDLISEEILDPPKTVFEDRSLGSESFTTGDEGIDNLIGGGIRLVSVWEIAGEGAAGKTQLALQLCLTVQLPVELGGRGGSSCYIASSSVIATPRLEELLGLHPQLSSAACSLDHIHTCLVDNTKALTYYLREEVPQLAQRCAAIEKPLKLLVIDSIGSFFQWTGKADTRQLVDRSKALAEVSSLLHNLVSSLQLAAVIINDVTAVFDGDGGTPNANPAFDRHELIYREQARWFNRPDDTFLDEKKEASLGLVWANQINVRLFLTRTGRMKEWIDDAPKAASTTGEEMERSAKRRRLDEINRTLNSLSSSSKPARTSILLRRIDVVFSAFGPPQSIDFVITRAGIRTVGSNIRRTYQPRSEDIMPMHESEEDYDG